MDDWSILQQYVRTRSPEVLTGLIQRYLNAVYSMCRRQLGDEHLAEDATQAVFLLMVQRAGQIRQGTILSGWLFQTARYTCANIRRASRRQHEREQRVSQMNSQTNDNLSELERLSPLLDDALAQLGSADRNVILLRYTQNLGFDEIGLQLGMSEPAVRKRVSRAIGRLRKYFARRNIVLEEASLGSIAVFEPAQTLLQSVTASIFQPGGKVSAIAKGVNLAMRIHTIKIALLSAAAVVVVSASAGGVANYAINRHPPTPLQANAGKPTAEKAQELAQAGDWTGAIDTYGEFLRTLTVDQYRDKKDFSWLLAENQKRSGNFDELSQVATQQLTRHKADEIYVWRLHRLLAEISENRNDATGQKSQIEQAITAYPQLVSGDPAKHSSLQHLYNSVAMLTAEKDVAAAEKYLLDHFKTDARFVYVFTLPWKDFYEKSGTPQRYQPFIKQIAAIYRSKSQQNPNQRKLLERYAKEHQAELER